MGGGADGGGLEGLEEEEAAVVGLVASTAGDELGDVERRKERVEVLARFAWPDAEEGGEDDGEEVAVEVDAARQVLGVLLGGARREEPLDVGGGGGDVRREERARDGRSRTVRAVVGGR